MYLSISPPAPAPPPQPVLVVWMLLLLTATLLFLAELASAVKHVAPPQVNTVEVAPGASPSPSPSVPYI